MKRFLVFCLLMTGLQAHAYIIYGQAAKLGNGEVRAFADVDKYGALQSIGFALSKDALEGLPMQMTDTTLHLPSILNIPPYTHLVVNWEPHGHEPDNIYGLPHFDFHFYMIPEEDRLKITCMGEDRIPCLTQPDPAKIPAFYVPTPEGVPQMGWHWVDPRSPEFNGQKFTSTFIYGFYNGNMTFVEPMVTREFLLSHPTFEKEIPQPQEYPADGFFPGKYSVSFDSSRNAYFVKLKNFVMPKSRKPSDKKELAVASADGVRGR